MSDAGPPRWRKPLLVLAAVAPIGVVLYIVAFQARYELAFDEENCPYVEVELREVGPGVTVREDRRSCLDGVEERRWVVHRSGHRPFELARRPLEAAAYGQGYAWDAEDDGTQVRVVVRNPGLEPRSFREPGPDSGLVDY